MLPKGANLQKIRDGKKTYAITPHIPAGFIKPSMLRKYADVAEKYHGVLKLTSAQRIMITNLKAEDIENVWADLGMEPAIGFANCVRSVKICPGNAFCKRGKQDTIKIGLELDKRYHTKEMPSRMKFGVAGCLNSCSEVCTKDIGILATENGWDVYVGGTAGSRPRLANLLITDLSADEALRMIEVIVAYYQKNADIERVGQFIDRITFEKFKEDVLNLYHNKDTTTEEPKDPQSDAGKQIAPYAGGLTEGNLVLGDKIEPDSVIADIIRIYPETIPVLRTFGMGCLGCPSAAGEPVTQAAEIHGINTEELLNALNKVIENKSKNK